MNKEAIQELMLKMADDALIMGHRDSEWTGLGPSLEEDIAFSSMSQDKIGHAWNLYRILHEQFGLPDPDRLAFYREEKDYKCAHLTELYTRDYAFALVRQFLFDHAQYQRFGMLKGSSFEPLAQFARKVTGEVKYHILHGDAWLKRLGKGNEESRARLQSAMNEVFPYALGIFEPGKFEDALKQEGVFEGEAALQAHWLEAIAPVLDAAGLNLPDAAATEAQLGGRHGYHTDQLQPLLDEMTEVLKTEPEGAEW